MRKYSSIQARNSRRTKQGLSSKIYYSQRARALNNNMPLPNYSLEELREWLFGNPLFDELYNTWKESGYKLELIPSCDRLDNYKSYTFENLQLMTWGENNERGHSDRKNGANNKQSRAVLQFDLDGNLVRKHYSISQARRETKIENIGHVCLGDQKTAGGYKWQYPELETIISTNKEEEDEG